MHWFKTTRFQIWINHTLRNFSVDGWLCIARNCNTGLPFLFIIKLMLNHRYKNDFVKTCLRKINFFPISYYLTYSKFILLFNKFQFSEKVICKRIIIYSSVLYSISCAKADWWEIKQLVSLFFNDDRNLIILLIN